MRKLLPVVLVSWLGLVPLSHAGTLYEDIGGLETLDRIVESLLDRVFLDERISFLFDPDTRDDLHDRVLEQFCAESGGPCEYTGLPMNEAHSGQEIKHKEFDAFVEDLILAMEDIDIPYRLQNRLLKIFAPMRGEIVYQ